MPDPRAVPDQSGSRVVESHGGRVEIVEPWRAGQHDPPMQDWLCLPAGDVCPADASHIGWGTRNPRGYFLVRYCHVCRAEFRGEVHPHTIHEVVSALCGIPRRFGLGFSPTRDEQRRGMEGS